jgi:hypothetical protein
MGAKSKKKGDRGELEIAHYLQAVVNDLYKDCNKPVPQILRTGYQQSGRDGGCDLMGIDWLAIEVKRCEVLKVVAWWEQCKRQAYNPMTKAYDRTPVLLYRQNRQDWHVRMFGQISAGTKRLLCPVDITFEVFLSWLRLRLLQEILS